jgi:hypothetical protein
MGRPKGMGRITTSVTLSPEFFMIAKEQHISFSEAIRVGLSLIFADKGIKAYDNRLNLYRKMLSFQKRTEELSQEIAEMKNAESKLHKGTEKGIQNP